MEDNRKIAWVKWEVVCREKNEGGLGVKDLRVFNASLLGKWAWKLLSSEGKSLWEKVLSSKYGNFSRCVEDWINGKLRDKMWSSWWRDLVSLVGRSRWFRDGLVRKIGDGMGTRFWEDEWVGCGVKLKVAFPRLYTLEVNKSCWVGERLSSVNESVVFKGVWRRNLFVWEEALLDELHLLMLKVEPLSQVPDSWLWKLSKDLQYSVKSGYAQWRQSNLNLQLDFPGWSTAVWNNLVPLKINVFLWRVLLDRAPTLGNLRRRNVLWNDDDARCRICKEEVVESAEHLFCKCIVIVEVWRLLGKWLETDVSLTGSVEENMDCFLSSVPVKWRKIWQIFWTGTVWFIWIARNNLYFQGNPLVLLEIVDKVKRNSWSWLKGKNIVSNCYNFNDWELCPRGVLNMLN